MPGADLSVYGDGSILLKEDAADYKWCFNATADDYFYSDELTTSPTGRNMVWRANGNVGIGTLSPSYPLEMGSGAYVSSGGVWTNASSRQYKDNIRDLTIQDAKAALMELKPTKFKYKADKKDESLGFISEDVPNLVATKDRKGLSTMDNEQQ